MITELNMNQITIVNGMAHYTILDVSQDFVQLDVVSASQRAALV